jgi:hypothetical protein
MSASQVCSYSMGDCPRRRLLNSDVLREEAQVHACLNRMWTGTITDEGEMERCTVE